MTQRFFASILFSLIPIATLFSANEFSIEDFSVENIIEQGVTVDLREPEFTDGVLTTSQGGVISGPDIRVQAQKIRYVKKDEDGVKTAQLEAEEDVMIEFGPYVIVGSKIVYDFETRTGVVYDGRTAVDPWFFGGETIKLCPDGSYVIYNGFVTTTETCRMDWSIKMKKATLNQCYDLRAKDVTFRFIRFPIFWMPSLSMKLDAIYENPFRYQVRFGGRHGPRLSMIYQVINWKNFKTFFRFDYRLKRGPGAGLVTEYKSRDRKQYFRTINYIAKDKSLTKPSVTNRYRFQGVYTNCLCDDKVSIDATYDKFSDRDVPTDYHDKGLQLCTGQRTQFHVRRQECNWITNFVTHCRVNSFQTVNQEIPSIETTWRPFQIGCTGIVSDMCCKLSFLDFVYNKTQPEDKDCKCKEGEKEKKEDSTKCKEGEGEKGKKEDPNRGYSSTRISLRKNLYRPFTFCGTTITPEISGLLIHYGDSPNNREQWMAMGLLNLSINTHLHRFYGKNKHVVTPYAEYQYYTRPTSDPQEHYIFSINDGWYRLNQLRTGLRNNIYRKCKNGCITRFLYLDLYANAFIDTTTVRNTIPKLYAELVFNPFPTMKQCCEVAWNFDVNQLDHINLRFEWTVSQNIAFWAEYRHRGAYDWRKADHTNFMLDSFEPVNELLKSSQSDKRDTFLLHFYGRFHPNWAVEFQSRNGWNRKKQRDYFEFATAVNGTVQSNWNIKVFYRHKKNDKRWGLNFNIGTNKPCSTTPCCPTPCLEF